MTSRRSNFSPAAYAFTLTELMISIALVVVLILGVNKVFKYTTDAVGAGQALSVITRDGNATRSVMANDFSQAVPNGTGSADSAFMLIRSQVRGAFRSQSDLLSDRDGDYRTRDVGDASGAESPEYPSGYSNGQSRYHRQDILTFFTRGTTVRQTGDDNINNVLANTDMGGTESLVWYGHLQLPDNQAVPLMFDPGAGTSQNNPNNFYSSQWVLGRYAIMLDRRIYDGGQKPLDANGQPTIFVTSRAPNAATALDPLQYDSPSSVGAYLKCQSRYDLADTSIQLYRDQLANYIRNNAVAGFYTPVANAAPYWWDKLSLTQRFQCNPYVTRPLNNRTLAQALPMLAAHCTQFVVEFAGDFVTQNNDPFDHNTGVTVPANPPGAYGDVLLPQPDGETDFVITGPNSTNGIGNRQIRWYGLPRDADGDGQIKAWSATNARNYQLPDVVPVRDVERTTIANGFIPTNWGGELFETDINDLTFGVPLPGNGRYDGSLGLKETNRYTCAFGPFDHRVRMIRILLTLDDANNRLPEGKTFEFVFNVPDATTSPGN